MHALLMATLAAAPLQIDAGPLVIRLHVSQTAQVFHIVDQLSGWTPFAHRQYREHLFGADAGGLSAADEQLLGEHAALRKRTGYGVLEPHFYADASIEQALAHAAADSRLSAADVEVERKVLAAFEPRLAPFLRARGRSLGELGGKLQAAKPKLTAFATRAAKFLAVGGAAVDVFVVPSPGTVAGGGGFNGGVLTLELVEQQAPLDVLLHESWHALAATRKDALSAAARAASTDFETVSEALAYAVSPGIWRFEGEKGDRLWRTVRRDLEANQSFFDEPLVRFNRAAIALRPSLETALAGDGTLDTYLPVEVAVLQGVAAVAETTARTERAYFVFPRAAKPLAQTLAEREQDVFTRDLSADAVLSVHAKVRKQDTLVLLLTPQSVEEVSAPLAELLGPRWAATAAAIKKQKTGELALSGGRADAVVVFGPTVEEAMTRATKSRLLLP